MKGKFNVRILTMFALSCCVTTLFAQSPLLRNIGPMDKTPMNQLKTQNNFQLKKIDPSMRATKNELPKVSSFAASGNSVRYALPEGVYNLPTQLYKGMPSAFVVPVKTDLTFVNKSKSTASGSWSYFTTFGGEELTSSNKDLEMNVPYPLTSGEDGDKSVQSPTLIVGTSDFYYAESMYAGLGAWPLCNMNPNKKVYYYTSNEAGTEFLYGKNPNFQWAALYELYKKPASPYYLASVEIPLYVDGNASGLQGTVGVYPLGDDGKIQDPLVEKTLSFNIDRQSFLLELDNPILLKTAFFIRVSIPYSASSVGWAPMNEAMDDVPTEDDEESASFYVEPGIEVTLEDGESLKPGSLYLQGTNAAFILNTILPTMYNMTTENNSYYYLPDVVEMGNEAAQGKWLIYSPFEPKTLVSDADWFKVSDLAAENADAGLYSYTIDMAASDVNRVAHVTVTDIYGYSYTFTFGQGEGSGISSIPSSSIKASCENSNFELNYTEDVTSVQIINVAGQTVGIYFLEGTSATIPATNLAKGLYLLKFNTGATVKVMR